MPYNFTTSKKYDFDFNVLYDGLMSPNSIFRPYEFYVRRWVHIFQSLNHYDTEVADFSIIRKHNGLGEYYQYKFAIDNQTFFLHFNIEVIKQKILTSPKDYPIQRIPLSYFGTSKGKIQYTDEPDGFISSKKNTPIILCDFPIEDSDYIVIDGNHRVTSSINNAEEWVDVVGCSPTNRNSFLSNVDWAMYLFKIETFELSYAADQGRDLLILLQQSNIFRTFNQI